ncbi:MAG: PfaD family polyunsaturated fatty acid/polyketide biosynthesis protein [bacterium]
MTQLTSHHYPELGWWYPEGELSPLDFTVLLNRLYHINQPVTVFQSDLGACLAGDKGYRSFTKPDKSPFYPAIAHAPSCPIERLGDTSFCRDWNIRYPAMTGSMANGISSIDLVAAMADAGMMGFYGSAGESTATVENVIKTLKHRCGDQPWGINLIHTPQEPVQEKRLVDILLRHEVHQIEASAFLTMTRDLVRYRVKGIHRNSDGDIVVPNAILAKASRVEIAEKFLSPPPEAILQELITCGDISEAEAELARTIPVARDITAEADSGGHTDNRPLVGVLPSFQAVARDCMEKYRYSQDLRVGAAGGIGTPAAAAAAFAMGAGWVVMGSIAQAAVESGTSDMVRNMLAKVEQAEITMAPAADMFEMGVNLQVLKHGTLFPMRARKLYELYKENDSLETLSVRDRTQLEKTIFRASLDQIWQETIAFWNQRDPSQIERAERDAKHKMALVFRWYLGLSSRWANAGLPDRQHDYQIWCGPAMGAFNQWTRGSFLAELANRTIETMVMNILWGAAVLFRRRNLQSHHLDIPHKLVDIKPQSISDIRAFIE